MSRFPKHILRRNKRSLIVNTFCIFASGDTCRLQESQGESDVQKERRGAKRALYVEGGQFSGPKKHVHLCCF
jgi:hypothetical protein